jgi:hypothetical protein
VTSATQQRKTAAGWTKTIDQMKAWGTPLGPDEQEAILAYLEASFGAPAASPIDAPR